jgi:centrosomal protein CEP104
MGIAASAAMGPALVGSRALIPIQGKQKSLARPLVGRLQILTSVVSTYGIGDKTNLSPEGLLNYCKNAGAFNHSAGEVRDACKDLAVALQAIIGTEPIEPYLSVLRPKQIEEYMTAFGEVKKTRPDDKLHRSEKPVAVAHTKEARTHLSPRGHAAAESKSGEKEKKREAQTADEAPDYTTCMFCGKSDRRWNEDALDLHYWKDCPLLFPCPACAQVVEIAGIPEHLVEECDMKNEYILDDVTGPVLTYSAIVSKPYWHVLTYLMVL